MEEILVVGELCTDKFVYGEVKRLSPEAPVPILNPSQVIINSGMAGNVVENLKILTPYSEIHLLHQKKEITKTRYVEKKSNHMFLRTDEGDDNVDALILDDNNNVLALIEFQGDQHFHPVPRWGGLHGHLSTAKHDQIKALFAQRNNIPLFYITESEQKKIYPMLEQLINYLFPQQIN